MRIACHTARLLIGLALVGQSWAQQPPANEDAPRLATRALVAFARSNAGKYGQELPAKGLQVGTPLTIRVQIPDWRFIGWHYDATKGQVSFVDSIGTINDFELLRTCRAGHSYVGQNSYGARARVQVQHCELAFLETPSGISFSGEASLTPNEYRLLRKNGTTADVDVVLGTNSEGHVAEEESAARAATVQEPTEYRGPRWTVYGEVREVRMFLPGRRVVTVYSKPN